MALTALLCNFVDARAHVAADQIKDTFVAGTILLACGSRPRQLDIPGAEHCISSDELFALPAMPSELIVVGAGCIGVEAGSILSTLGSKVTIVHKGSQLLPGLQLPACAMTLVKVVMAAA